MFYTFLLVATALVSLFAGLYALRYRGTPGGWPLIGLFAAAFWWAGCHAFEVAATDLNTKLFWNNLTVISGAGFPALSLLFVAQYTSSTKWFNPVMYGLLGFEPLLVVLAAWTNPWHSLYRLSAGLTQMGSTSVLMIERGPLNILHLAYAYGLMTFSTFVLTAAMLRAPRLYQRTFGMLLIAILVILLGNAMFVLNRSHIAFNPTPVVVALSALIMLGVLSQMSVFEVAPIAPHALFEHLRDALIVLDMHDRIVDLNPAGEEVLGRPAKTLIGQTLQSVNSELAELLNHYVEDQKTSLDIVLATSTGRHDYGMQIAPVTTQGGQKTGRIVALRDITVRKSAEDALRHSEERFQRVADATRDVIYEIDFRTGEVWWSRGVAVQFGFAESDVKPNQDWWLSCIHPDDREKVIASFNAMVKGGGQFWSREYRVLKGDGEEAYVFDRGYMSHDVDGKPQHFIGALMDITARRIAEDALRQSEERYRRLVETAQEGIWVTDTGGSTTFVNKRMAEMLGYSSSDMMGKPMYQFMDDDGIQTMSTGLEHQNGGVERYDLRFKRRDGSDLWAILSIRSIQGDRGQYTGAMAMVTDVTERKRGEDELREQKQLFENLVAVARAAAELPSLDATLNNVLEVSLSLTRAETGNVILVDEFRKVTHVLRKGQDETQVFATHGEEIMDRGLTGWVSRNRQTAWIADTSHDERWLPLPDSRFNNSSALCVPIFSGGEFLGVLTLLHIDQNHFTQADVTMIEAAIAQMALALRNARMFEQTRQLAEEMYMLNQITRAALEANTLDDLYQTLADRMGELLKADACYINEWDDVTKRAKGRAASRDAAYASQNLLTSHEGEMTLTRSVLEAGHAIAISEASATHYMSPRIIETFKTKSVLGLPLIARGRKLGSVVFDYKDKHTFTDEEIATGERASRQVALALSNALLYKEITDQHGQLQALTESSRDGIILVSLSLHILFCNSITLTLLGLPGQASDWVGAPLSRALKHLHKRSPSLVRAALEETRRIERGNEPMAGAEHEVLGRHLRWMSQPVLAAGEPLGRLVVLRDVTEERALERMREDLTHMMVHDLRSPLTVMMIATETLDNTKASRRNTDLVTMIQEASARMLALVDAILDLSQLEANRMPMEHTPVALGMLADKTLQLNAAVIEKKHIQLTADIPTNLPYLWADMRLLDRVLQNLLNNAMKFTPEGGTIRVIAKIDPAKPKVAEISVFNSGPGIPTEIKSRLFQKFVRGRQKEQGNGLGLAFCRLVVEAHEGRIWVDSEPGQGATFYFTLPVHQG